MNGNELLVYTNDGKCVLYKYGLKNHTVERRLMSNPLDLFSKKGDPANVVELDRAAADLPKNQSDLGLE